MGVAARSLGSVASSFFSPQYVILQNFKVAVLYRTLQLVAVSITVLLLWVQDSWAEVERAEGVFNPWAETGTSAAAANTPDYRIGHPYCSNDAWSYAYASWFELDRPLCRALTTGEGTCT